MDLFVVSYVVLWALVIVLIFVVLAILRTFGGYYLSSGAAASRDGPPIGSTVSDFSGYLLDGTLVGRELMVGRWAVMLFATPLCQDCYAMLPWLGQLRDDLGGRVECFLMFRGDVEDARAIRWLDSSPIPVVAVGRKGIGERLKIRVSPYVLVMDPNGAFRAKGLVSSREGVEHLLAQAGLDHPLIAKHELELASQGGAHHG